MKLIFIHGRAQGGKEYNALRKSWITAFKEGLKLSKLTLPISESDIIFPFYGDKLDEFVEESKKPINDIVQKGSNSSGVEAEFLYNFLLNVASNANISEKEIEQYIDEEVTEKGFQNWPWVQAILRAIDNKTPWSEVAIKKYFTDVYLYLTNKNIQEQINSIVLEAFDNEKCVVVGHSLGSILGYNILRNNEDFKIAKYITLGSPLGIKAIKKHLDTPIKMPDCVSGGWYNAFDERDVVSLNSLDKINFNINPSIINNNQVFNYTDNKHGIEGYLNDKNIALEIYKYLNT